MKKEFNNQNENGKRNAFKRFSQIGAGLAVLSMSVYTNVQVKQLPANTEKAPQKEQNLSAMNVIADKSIVMNDELLDMNNERFAYYNSCPTPYGDYSNYSNYSDYYNYYNYNNYSNYSDYSNYYNYSNSYYNAYSNYCNTAN